MHYRNGREAKNGDKVVQFQMDGSRIVAVGVLHDAVAGNDYCNGQIASTVQQLSGACMCDCLHIDDVAELLKKNGLDRRIQLVNVSPTIPTATVTDQENDKAAVSLCDQPAKLAEPSVTVTDQALPSIDASLCPDCGNSECGRGCARYGTV